MIIIGRISFWINKPFEESITDALDQFKKQSYVEKLKTHITLESMSTNDKELWRFLYDLIIHI